MWPNSQFPADLVTVTEEILNGFFFFFFFFFLYSDECDDVYVGSLA